MEIPSWQRASALVGTFGILLAACGSNAPAASSAPSAAQSAAASASSAPKQARGAGGNLNILYWEAPTILDPHLATGTKDFDASRLVLEPLADWDPSAKPVPELAAEIPTVANGGVSTDLTSVTWKLKPGLKWSDGSAFSSSDVVFTYKLMCDKTAGTSTFGYCDNVDSVTAPDANTVVVKYKTPNANFYQWGVGENTDIVQEAQFKSCTGAALKNCPANLKPIGTGPYMVKDFKPGDVVDYALNPNFRDPNKPFFKTVTFKGGGDATSAARACFETGQVDYAWNLQVAASVLKPMMDASSAKCRMVTAYGNSTERLLLNRANPDASLGDKRSEPGTTHPFFSDAHVRRALAMASDRDSIATQLYGGITGRPTCDVVSGPPPVVSPALKSSDVCKFDINAAKKELQDDGWIPGPDGVRAKNGVKLNIIFQTTTNDLRQKEQAILKQGWEQAGFGVTLRNSSASTFFTNTAPDGANKFYADVEMFTNSGDPDPTALFQNYTCDQMAAQANNWNNGGYERYCNKQFDALWASSKKETDPEKRDVIFQQMNQWVAEHVVDITLVDRTNVSSAASKDLKGLQPNGWASEMWNIADWYK
ncbi:MAG: peptide ABC transporter substrate-binding protein [Chloroflexi bacterium]|nr:peptide ABC transporter substrate-binding protein [Chloroflexota bacterium]